MSRIRDLSGDSLTFELVALQMVNALGEDKARDAVQEAALRMGLARAGVDPRTGARALG